MVYMAFSLSATMELYLGFLDFFGFFGILYCIMLFSGFICGFILFWHEICYYIREGNPYFFMSTGHLYISHAPHLIYLFTHLFEVDLFICRFIYIVWIYFIIRIKAVNISSVWDAELYISCSARLFTSFILRYGTLCCFRDSVHRSIRILVFSRGIPLKHVALG